MSGYLDPTGVCDVLSPSDPYWTCAGCGLDGVESYNEWINLNCPLQFQQLYGKPIGSSIEPTLSGADTARLLANNLLDTYFSSGAEDAFEGVLHQFCNNPGVNPGVCQNYLTYVKCPQYYYDEMTPNQVDWCGCLVMPPDQDRQIYGDNIACYPLCHQASTVQLVDSQNRLIQCNNQVCIVDDVTVNVVDSRTGNVNLTQICPGCSGDCTCIVNDVDVIGTGLNIQQYCGPNTQCWRTVNGELREVPCEVITSSQLWLWLIVIIGIILIIVVIIIAFYQAIRYANQPTRVVIRRE